ncbi:MAG: DUF2807 domain-containing protein [Saprospirales bacterium]|jgi:hypothetical protein|nr:DUF2807 domain-containing protein [Saprospirales bacterium]
MRYLILFMFLVAIFVLGNRSCKTDGWAFGLGGVRGEGPVKTETRPVRDFHAVNAQVPGNIEVRISEQFSVEVQAQENLLPILKTVVEDGALRVYFEKNTSHVEGLKVLISAPAFDGLSLSGSGRLEVLTPISGEHLNLSISGSGEMDVPQADIGQMHCNISGSGDMRLSGKAAQADFQISGSGDVDAKALAAEKSSTTIAGSGTVTCRVAQTLKAEIAGSGDVFYVGSPAVDTDIAGSGKVKKID